ncbi:MAG TPA: endonuclease/exonuclease/phosphatase family protein, partial [Gaiellaceae bacterium]|nr:endonuclease/exonuclease/phosphatase family protein [Gaiellaceae bacterium]
MRKALTPILIATLVALGSAGSAVADGGGKSSQLRFATFNASLNRNAPGQLLADLSTTSNAQAKAVAEIVQRTRPDVLLVNEFDYEPAALALF